MLLKTFLKKLDIQPIKIRYDHYENKDILEFEKKEGYFPYIEIQSQPKNGQQKIYFDVLNWENDNTSEKYVTKNYIAPKGFILLASLNPTNQLSTLDSINERLHAFYMLYSYSK